MNTRSTEGKQQMGQSVFPGSSANRVGILVCLHLSSPLFTVFWHNFLFPQRSPSLNFSCICALWLYHCSNGRMESTQSQANSSRIWPECFAWIPASPKAKEKCLSLWYVHSHGKPRRVSHGILWAPRQWALFPSTTGSSGLCKLVMIRLEWHQLVLTKCETAHGSFWCGKMVLCTVLPFEGDSSLSLISHLLLLKPKVRNFKSNYIRYT